MEFDTFYELALSKALQRNSLNYHPCCDSWATRNVKSKKLTHSKTMSWKEIIMTLDKSAEDKKGAMNAMMNENGMQIPVLLNYPCHGKKIKLSSQKILPEAQKSSPSEEKFQEGIDSKSSISSEEKYIKKIDTCINSLGIDFKYYSRHLNQVQLQSQFFQYKAQPTSSEYFSLT